MEYQKGPIQLWVFAGSQIGIYAASIHYTLYQHAILKCLNSNEKKGSIRVLLQCFSLKTVHREFGHPILLLVQLEK